MSNLKKIVQLNPEKTKVFSVQEVPEEAYENLMKLGIFAEYVDGVESGDLYENGKYTRVGIDYAALLEDKCGLIDKARLEKQKIGMPWKFGEVWDVVQLRDETDKGNVDRLVTLATAELVLSGGNSEKTFTFYGKKNIGYNMTAREVVAMGNAVQDFIERLLKIGRNYKVEIRRMEQPFDIAYLYDLPDWPNVQ